MLGQGFSDFRAPPRNRQVFGEGDRRQRIAERCRSFAGGALLGRFAFAAFATARLPTLARRNAAAGRARGLRRTCAFRAAFAAGSISGRLLRGRAARLLARLACRTALPPCGRWPAGCWGGFFLLASDIVFYIDWARKPRSAL